MDITLLEILIFIGVLVLIALVSFIVRCFLKRLTIKAEFLEKLVEQNGIMDELPNIRYVIFELAGGKRVKPKLKAYQYNSIVVGDAGGLAYQGTKFLEFNGTK